MVTSANLTTSRLQYAFDRPEYTVVPGGTVDVTVFLRETVDPATGPSLLAPGGDGLVSIGFAIQARTDAARPARVRSASCITGNPEFDFAVIPQLSVPTVENAVGLIAL